MSLAINGGTPVRKEPFPPRIMIGEEEQQAVIDIMKECRTKGGSFDRYGGTQVDAFEKEFAEYYGIAYATATSSGTAAIHSALGALQLDAFSEVISSPITDPGAVAPILFQSCIPVFADADSETFNIDPTSLEERISRKTKAIIVGHIAGQPCDMDPIMAIAENHNLTVIEDCSQSHDALYKGKKAGTIGRIGCFSLMSGKHITSGGQGGMVITDDEELYCNAKRFADRGKSFGTAITSILFLGNNYRMTEIAAAIGRVQLKKLPLIVETRRKLVDKLRRKIKGHETVCLGKVIKGAISSYWFVFLRIYERKLKVSIEKFGEAVVGEGIPLGGKYDHLVYEQTWIKERQTFGKSKYPWAAAQWGLARDITYEGSCPNAKRAIATHLVLPIHECYTDKEIDDSAEALTKVESHYQKR